MNPADRVRDAAMAAFEGWWRGHPLSVRGILGASDEPYQGPISDADAEWIFMGAFKAALALPVEGEAGAWGGFFGDDEAPIITWELDRKGDAERWLREWTRIGSDRPPRIAPLYASPVAPSPSIADYLEAHGYSGAAQLVRRDFPGAPTPAAPVEAECSTCGSEFREPRASLACPDAFHESQSPAKPDEVCWMCGFTTNDAVPADGTKHECRDRVACVGRARASAGLPPRANAAKPDDVGMASLTELMTTGVSLVNGGDHFPKRTMIVSPDLYEAFKTEFSAERAAKEGG